MEKSAKSIEYAASRPQMMEIFNLSRIRINGRRFIKSLRWMLGIMVMAAIFANVAVTLKDGLKIANVREWPEPEAPAIDQVTKGEVFWSIRCAEYHLLCSLEKMS